MRTPLDPVTTQIVWTRLVSIAEEQARTLYRGSFSTVISEIEDYCSTLHDAVGNMIAQSTSSGTISMLTGAIKSTKLIARLFKDRIDPGDAIISNDPWLMAGHKYDCALTTPIFHREALVGWAVTNLHAADIGGRGFTAAAQDTFEEGLTFPPLKLFKRSNPNQDLFDMIRANVRMADQVVGDFMAQASANELGASKVAALLHEYDLPDLDLISAEIIGRSEAALRRAIDGLVDGVYKHSVTLDGFDESLQISCAITVRGSDLSADFAGTSPQVPGAINAVGHVAYGRVAHAVKAALAPTIPNNEGFFRPITVTAPEGSLVNARYPAPTAARHVLHFFLSAAAFGALAKVTPPPSGIIADSGAGILHSLRGWSDAGTPYEYWFHFSHGMGATARRDGYSGTCAPNNVASTPVEIIESRTPVFVLGKQLVPDSEGPGRYRGGFAQRYSFRVRSERPTQLACMFDRVKHPPLGFLGGMNGATAAVKIGARDVHPKGTHELQASDVVTVVGPGGGGFFAPWEREPERVLEDVIDGLVSPKAALERYQVILAAGGRAVDLEATAKLRKRARKAVVGERSAPKASTRDVSAT